MTGANREVYLAISGMVVEILISSEIDFCGRKSLSVSGVFF